MTPAQLFAGIRDGNFHEGGIRCLQLLRLDETYLATLTAEVIRLIDAEHGSDVGDVAHVTNWTRPRGKVTQFSLFNASGRFDDFSCDHDSSSFGKRFDGGSSYPELLRLINWLPHIVNFRVNVMGPHASLSAHEEHAVVRSRAGSVYARLRLHLPILTNQGAELMIDGSVFHLTSGTIYLVNHGCVHSASNRGAQRRVHLVWDMPLTREVFEILFSELPPRSMPMSRIAEAEREPEARRTERIGAYMQLLPPVGRAEADRLDWCEVQ